MPSKEVRVKICTRQFVERLKAAMHHMTNDELDALIEDIEEHLDTEKVDGRLVVVASPSLDRIVRRAEARAS